MTSIADINSVLTDTEGAIVILAERFKKKYSADSIRNFVKQERLPAFIFQGGQLVEREPNADTRGKDMFFLRADLYVMERPQPAGNPHLRKLSA